MSKAEVVVFTGIRAAIIDLDGTMVDTALDFHAAVNRMRRDLSLGAQELDLVRSFVGKGFAHLIRQSLSLNLGAEEVDRIFPDAREAFLRHYTAVNGTTSVLYPGVAEGLLAMREKGLRLACVTNKQARFALPLLERMKVHDLFDLIYPGDALPRMKPDPLPMLTVMERFNVRPPEVVAIGDSTNDTLAARAAGCWVLTVPYGYNHGRPVQEANSDGIVDSLLEAANCIS
jgi:phosphoglycolate phosphatase